jgi:hypothetical protein
MSSNKFPAQFLSAYDIGKRVRVKSLTGAVVEDILTDVRATADSDKGKNVRLILTFQSVSHTDSYGRGGFEVALDSWAKRWTA